MPRKKTYEEVKELFDFCGYILISDTYNSALEKLDYICPKHSDKIQQISYNKLKDGRGCPYCSKKKKKTLAEAKQAFMECGYELLEEEYKNCTTKMRYKCPNHPDKELYLRLSDLLNGVRCPYCSKVGRKNLDEVKEEFRLRGYKLLSDVYINTKQRLNYICEKHPQYIFSINYGNFSYGEGCPLCKESKGERKIRAYLEKNGVDFDCQKTFKDLRNLNTGRLLSYDFYLPGYNLLIEYQGSYHDGTVNKRNPKRQTEQQVKEQQDRDNLKKEYAKNHNIKLLEIWYWDYKKIEEILNKELVK